MGDSPWEMKDTTKQNGRYAMGDPRWEMGDQGSEKGHRRGEIRDGRWERTEHKGDETEAELRDVKGGMGDRT